MEPTTGASQPSSHAPSAGGESAAAPAPLQALAPTPPSVAAPAPVGVPAPAPAAAPAPAPAPAKPVALPMAATAVPTAPTMIAVPPTTMVLQVPRANKAQPPPAAPTENFVLPKWSKEEVDKRLEECARLLKLWEEHMNKTDKMTKEQLLAAADDLGRHASLKRKLHDTLGIMARMVQNQVKMRKPADGTGAAPGTVAPPSVAGAGPGQGAQRLAPNPVQHPMQSTAQPGGPMAGRMVAPPGYVPAGYSASTNMQYGPHVGYAPRPMYAQTSQLSNAPAHIANNPSHQNYSMEQQYAMANNMAYARGGNLPTNAGSSSMMHTGVPNAYPRGPSDQGGYSMPVNAQSATPSGMVPQNTGPSAVMNRPAHYPIQNVPQGYYYSNYPAQPTGEPSTNPAYKVSGKPGTADPSSAAASGAAAHPSRAYYSAPGAMMYNPGVQPQFVSIAANGKMVGSNQPGGVMPDAAQPNPHGALPAGHQGGYYYAQTPYAYNQQTNYLYQQQLMKGYPMHGPGVQPGTMSGTPSASQPGQQAPPTSNTSGGTGSAAPMQMGAGQSNQNAPGMSAYPMHGQGPSQYMAASQASSAAPSAQPSSQSASAPGTMPSSVPSHSQQQQQQQQYAHTYGQSMPLAPSQHHQPPLAQGYPYRGPPDSNMGPAAVAMNGGGSSSAGQSIPPSNQVASAGLSTLNSTR